jgi:hypothetical protein
MIRALLSSSIAVAIAVTGGAAHAQKKVEATAAFQKGQQLKKEGKTAQACAAFAQSMAFDAQFGTQYNLALCYLDLGRTASAWAELNELGNKDTNEKRRADAAKRAKELEGKLTRVSIALAEQPEGLVVLRDEVDVTVLIGSAFAVDPGPHVFTARADGRREWSAKFEITGAGKTINVEIPKLEPETVVSPGTGRDDPDPDPGTGGTGGTGNVVGPGGTDPVDTGPPSPGRTRRIIALVLGGAGVVGLGAGAFYGRKAMSKADEARDVCGGELDPCFGDADYAEELVEDGRGFATISNIGFIGGGALLAAGVVLYLTAPSGVSAAPIATGDTLGMVVSAPF